MQVLHPRCAGLDVHKDSVMAAVRLAEAGGVRCEVRRFETTTPGLLTLGAWLAECGCTHAAMEATGVYCPGSTGRRNACLRRVQHLIKGFGGRSPAERLARPAVERRGHGRALSAAATAARSSAPCALRSVPFGKYCRSSPFVFSFVPRCHGLCGSQK